jgi:hypothetical protein
MRAQLLMFGPSNLFVIPTQRYTATSVTAPGLAEKPDHQSQASVLWCLAEATCMYLGQRIAMETDR